MKLNTERVRHLIGDPAQWREEHATKRRPIKWDDGYGAPEASLVLDPTTMDIDGFSEIERRVILGFCLTMDGRFGTSTAAGTEAADRWGVTAHALGLSAANRGEVRQALFSDATHAGFFLPVDDAPRVQRTIALAPSRGADGEVWPTERARNTFALQRLGVASCPVPKTLRTLSLLRELFIEAFELLFVLYGINDMDRYGGADPAHVRLQGSDVVVSDALLRAWRFDSDTLVTALAELHDAGLVAFVPAQLDHWRWYPAADEQTHYRGDCGDPGCNTFVVRPIHQVERFALEWAA